MSEQKTDTDDTVVCASLFYRPYSGQDEPSRRMYKYFNELVHHTRGEKDKEERWQPGGDTQL